MNTLLQLTTDEAQLLQRLVLKEATALHLEITRHKMQFPKHLQDREYLNLLNKRAFDSQCILRKCVIIPEELKFIGEPNNE